MVLLPLDWFQHVMHSFNCRGSLYKLLHRTGAREVLDERRRLNMAFDVVLPSLTLPVSQDCFYSLAIQLKQSYYYLNSLPGLQAKGMNYLHRRSPPIVHRDLKSPNLLVDKKYTVKVWSIHYVYLTPCYTYIIDCMFWCIFYGRWLEGIHIVPEYCCPWESMSLCIELSIFSYCYVLLWSIFFILILSWHVLTGCQTCNNLYVTLSCSRLCENKIRKAKHH
jgi:serine/threonine protein kinase